MNKIYFDFLKRYPIYQKSGGYNVLAKSWDDVRLGKCPSHIRKYTKSRIYFMFWGIEQTTNIARVYMVRRYIKDNETTKNAVKRTWLSLERQLKKGTIKENGKITNLIGVCPVSFIPNDWKDWLSFLNNE